jgi:hypothetical protein
VPSAEDQTTAGGRRFGLWILDNVVFRREGGGRSEEKTRSNDKLLHGCVAEILKSRTQSDNVGFSTDRINIVTGGMTSPFYSANS